MIDMAVGLVHNCTSCKEGGVSVSKGDFSVAVMMLQIISIRL